MARLHRATVVAVAALALVTSACTLDPTAGMSPSGSTDDQTTGATEPVDDGSSTSASASTSTPGPTGSTSASGSTAGQSPTSDAPTGSASPSGQPTTGATQTSATSTPPTQDDGGDAPPFTADTSDDTGAGTGSEVGSLVDLRVGAHDGFDRVVIELDGPDIPAWDVGYVDQALGDPSGIVVDVDGDAVLQVLLHPVEYPEFGGDPYTGPQKVTGWGTEVVAEAVLSSIFEGELQLFVGVDGGRQPFRAYGMSDPSRVVIEVREPLG